VKRVRGVPQDLFCLKPCCSFDRRGSINSRNLRNRMCSKIFDNKERTMIGRKESGSLREPFLLYGGVIVPALKFGIEH